MKPECKSCGYNNQYNNSTICAYCGYDRPINGLVDWVEQYRERISFLGIHGCRQDLISVHTGFSEVELLPIKDIIRYVDTNYIYIKPVLHHYMDTSIVNLMSSGGKERFRKRNDAARYRKLHNPKRT